MRPLSLRPLDREAYAPYGDLLVAGPDGTGRGANQGTARVFDRLVRLDNLRADAPLNVSLFRCAPRTERPFPVTMLERHPSSAQLFVPMQPARFVAVVALGGDRPDLSTLAAFLVPPGHGVSYRPGTWHHPLIALDRTTDFACFVHEDGGPGDCEVVPLAAHERCAIEIPDET